MDDGLLNKPKSDTPSDSSAPVGDDVQNKIDDALNKLPDDLEKKMPPPINSSPTIPSTSTPTPTPPISTPPTSTPSDDLSKPITPPVTPSVSMPTTPTDTTPPTTPSSPPAGLPPLPETPEVEKPLDSARDKEMPEIKPEKVGTVKPPSKFKQGLKKNGKKFIGGVLLMALLTGGVIVGRDIVQERQQVESEAAGANEGVTIKGKNIETVTCTDGKCTKRVTKIKDDVYKGLKIKSEGESISTDKAMTDTEWENLQKEALSYASGGGGEMCKSTSAKNCIDKYEGYSFFSSNLVVPKEASDQVIAEKLENAQMCKFTCNADDDGHCTLSADCSAEMKEFGEELFRRTLAKLVTMIDTGKLGKDFYITVVGDDLLGKTTISDPADIIDYLRNNLTAGWAIYTCDADSYYNNDERSDTACSNNDYASLLDMLENGCGFVQMDINASGTRGIDFQIPCSPDTPDTPSSPPPTPTPPPSDEYSCVNLEGDPSTVQLGDTVTFSCTAAFSGYSPMAYFRYSSDGGVTYTDDPGVYDLTVNNPAQMSLLIDDYGDYVVQCRVCTDAGQTNCTGWGQAN
ncbi:immunoglobulin domain-containing protein [Patescibacteria group bacterium]